MNFRTPWKTQSAPRQWKRLLAGCFLSVALSTPLHADPQALKQAIDNLNPELNNHDARSRLNAWYQFIQDNLEKEEDEKLANVNAFFNRIPFVSDEAMWRQPDYWATPVEFLARDGGDCEDFAIAKYFTLRALGVTDDKLQLTYVKALELNQAHMVLTYFSTPDVTPLVLDNLQSAIQPADQRSDLLPIFSFNAKSLWLARERGRGKAQLLGSAERVNLWKDLLNRME